MPQERCKTCSYRLPPSWTGKRHCPSCGSPLEPEQSKTVAFTVSEVETKKKPAAKKKTSGSTKRNKK